MVLCLLSLVPVHRQYSWKHSSPRHSRDWIKRSGMLLVHQRQNRSRRPLFSVHPTRMASPVVCSARTGTLKLKIKTISPIRVAESIALAQNNTASNSHTHNVTQAKAKVFRSRATAPQAGQQRQTTVKWNDPNTSPSFPKRTLADPVSRERVPSPTDSLRSLPPQSLFPTISSSPHVSNLSQALVPQRRQKIN